MEAIFEKKIIRNDGLEVDLCARFDLSFAPFVGLTIMSQNCEEKIIDVKWDYDRKVFFVTTPQETVPMGKENDPYIRGKYYPFGWKYFDEQD